jgi:hypothetical protein
MLVVWGHVTGEVSDAGLRTVSFSFLSSFYLISFSVLLLCLGSSFDE